MVRSRATVLVFLTCLATMPAFGDCSVFARLWQPKKPPAPPKIEEERFPSVFLPNNAPSIETRYADVAKENRLAYDELRTAPGSVRDASGLLHLNGPDGLLIDRATVANTADWRLNAEGASWDPPAKPSELIRTLATAARERFLDAFRDLSKVDFRNLTVDGLREYLKEGYSIRAAGKVGEDQTFVVEKDGKTLCYVLTQGSRELSLLVPWDSPIDMRSEGGAGTPSGAARIDLEQVPFHGVRLAGAEPLRLLADGTPVARARARGRSLDDVVRDTNEHAYRDFTPQDLLTRRERALRESRREATWKRLYPDDVRERDARIVQMLRTPPAKPPPPLEAAPNYASPTQQALLQHWRKESPGLLPGEQRLLLTFLQEAESVAEHLPERERTAWLSSVTKALDGHAVTEADLTATRKKFFPALPAAALAPNFISKERPLPQFSDYWIAQSPKLNPQDRQTLHDVLQWGARANEDAYSDMEAAIASGATPAQLKELSDILKKHRGWENSEHWVRAMPTVRLPPGPQMSAPPGRLSRYWETNFSSLNSHEEAQLRSIFFRLHTRSASQAHQDEVANLLEAPLTMKERITAVRAFLDKTYPEPKVLTAEETRVRFSPAAKR